MKATIINSLPKSGTNLLAKCLLLLGYQAKGHIGSHIVLGRNIWSSINRLLYSSVRPGYIVGIDSPVEIARFVINKKLQSVNRREFLTAHVGYTFDLLNEVLKAGLCPIVVVRDPRAVLASFVPYVLKSKDHPFHKLLCSLRHEDRFKAVLHGYSGEGYSLQPMRVRCTALDLWLNNRESLVVRFEDIIGKKGGGNDDIQKQTLISLCDHLQISAKDVPYVSENLFGDDRRTFRTGKVDSWKDEIPSNVQAEFQESIGDILNNWEY
jgi:hypothetical protein